MLCIFVFVAGKHQCRALAENMYSPSEGLKEINHQLSTGVAQELIHFCNLLGQGATHRAVLVTVTAISVF